MMGIELVPTSKVPKSQSLATRLIVKALSTAHALGCSARALKTLAMESSLHHDSKNLAMITQPPFLDYTICYFCISFYSA